MLHLLLSRWSRRNDKNLCNHHLAHPVFSGTIFASTVSRRGNRCEQVYVTDFGWARAFTVASRSEAHETLWLLFARDGVLPACICDNAKEMIQGKFYQKLKHAACHLKQMELHTSWSDASEREMKELKNWWTVSCCIPEHQSACGMTA